jgi:hydrogen peroxide-dependent heme synthase
MFSTSLDLGYVSESLKPGDGWHCSHWFYSFDRHALAKMEPSQIREAKREFVAILDPKPGRPERLQTGCVVGHKADFSLMLMDPDPIKIESVNQRLLASRLGQALKTEFSYISFSEISEYVQTEIQYTEKLQREGEDPNSSVYQTKVRVYAERLAKMNFQRLTPEFPSWPVSCFYPMNKWRKPDANWFLLPTSERHRLMAEHARSGIRFAGKVSQLITVGVGLDNWEWGVTLWAINPQYLKQIVYEMRFDEASARYAEFGPFFTSYGASPEKILEFCGI